MGLIVTEYYFLLTCEDMIISSLNLSSKCITIMKVSFFST